jgi:hypothetical protein
MKTSIKFCQSKYQAFYDGVLKLLEEKHLAHKPKVISANELTFEVNGVDILFAFKEFYLRLNERERTWDPIYLVLVDVRYEDFILDGKNPPPDIEIEFVKCFNAYGEEIDIQILHDLLSN